MLEVDNGTDYRLLKMEKLKVYHVGPGAEVALGRAFDALKDVEEEHHELDVEGRSVTYRKRAGGVVWFDFSVLCGGPRSYTDRITSYNVCYTKLLRSAMIVMLPPGPP